MGKRLPIDAYCEKKIPTLQKDYDGLIDYVDISSVDNASKKIISFQTIDAKDAPSRAKQLLKKGDIVVSTVRPNLNAVAVVEEETDNLMVGSTGYCVLRCTDSMDTRYLFNYCQSQYFVEDMTSQATGASYPAVSNGIVRSSLIPDLPIEQQRKIAEQLDSVGELIDLRKQQLKELDQLVKSRFIELFGDPLVENDRYKKVPLGNLTEVGSSKRIFEKEYVNDGIPFYRTKEIVELSKGNKITTELFISRERFDEIRTNYGVPQAGDLLISAVGTIGTIWIVDGKNDFYYKDGNLLRVSLSPYFNPIYLKELLESLISKYKLSMSAGTAYAALTISALKEMLVHEVPIELQNEFAAFVEHTDKLKLAVTEALAELETLKKSLMQQYFG